MFLNYIKDFFVKKTLNKNLHTVKNEVFTSNVQTIGLLVDETKFRHSRKLMEELTKQGIAVDKIQIVAYRGKLDKKKVYSRPTFGKKDINWKGEITEVFLDQFIDTEFDLLISYYDAEKAVLMLITQKSKAKFKVGFSSVDNKLNRWMINTDMESYKPFVSELFKYLKNIK